MPDSLITHLRHVDLAIPDYERQLAFYTGVWGLTKVAEDSGIAFLAAEGSPERYIIRLRRDADKRLDLVSFGASTAADVDTLAELLIAKGVPIAAEPGPLGTEGGGYGLRLFDLDGRTVEISANVAPRTHRKVTEGESIPVRLSHVVLNSTDPDQTAQWYADVLDFRLSDTLAGADLGTVMNFMRGAGRVLRNGTKMVWGPGRHLAGSNTFAYFLDPQNNTIEYTTELAELDEDAWHPHVYDMHDPSVQDQWGTANPINELVARESFNDQDPGLFTAPPV